METALKYFKEADKILQRNDFADEDDKSIFVQNVFSEIEGLEYRLSCSHDGSTILEGLLRVANSFQLRVFFEKIRGKMVDMWCHRYASHVMETWLRRAAICPSDEAPSSESNSDDLPALGKQLSDMEEFVGDEFIRLSEDAYGTHVLRLLLKLWSGDLDGKAIKFPNGQSNLFALCKKLTTLPGEVFHLESLVQHKQVSPVLQMFITLLAGQEGGKVHCKKLLVPLFPILTKGKSSDEAAVSRGKDIFSKLAQHEVGSRFLEAMISSLEESDFVKFFDKLVKKEVPRLLDGFNSNFVIQTLLSKSPNEDQFSSILSTLKPLSDSLVKKKRHGVLIRMAQWVNEHQSQCAEPVMEIIKKAFNVEDSELIAAISRLQTKENLKVTDVGRFEAGGLSLLLILPHFPATVAKGIIDGFLALTPTDLVQYSTHAVGSRVIEALFTSATVSDNVKQRVARKMREHVDALAMDRYGSHVFDKAWAVATVELRETMLGKMLAMRTKLEDNSHGRLVLRNCRASEYERDPMSWRKSESGVVKKREMFADIIEEDKPSKKAKKEDSIKKSKTKSVVDDATADNILPKELMVSKSIKKKDKNEKSKKN